MNLSLSPSANNKSWSEHPYLIHFAGLGPLLAVTSNAATGLVYGIACLFVLIGSSTLVSLMPLKQGSAIRLPAIAVAVATLASLAELFLQTHYFAMTKALGIFVPLLASQSFIYLAAGQEPTRLLQVLRTGCTYLLALVLIGLIREFISTGSILSDANLLFNELEDSAIQLLGETWRFKLIELAPGAFITLGLLLALINSVWSKDSLEK